MTAPEEMPFDRKQDLNEILLSWKSPSHPFRKRNKVFYQTIAAFTFLSVVIVFFLQEFLLIGVILSIVFVVYIVSSNPPIEVEHKITPLGFRNAGRLFRWAELYAFWFEEKWGDKLLIIQTRLPFPAQLRIVLKDTSEDKIKKVIGKYLPYLEKPLKGWVDNIIDWVNTKIPFETTD